MHAQTSSYMLMRGLRFCTFPAYGLRVFKHWLMSSCLWSLLYACLEKIIKIFWCTPRKQGNQIFQLGNKFFLRSSRYLLQELMLGRLGLHSLRKTHPVWISMLEVQYLREADWFMTDSFLSILICENFLENHGEVFHSCFTYIVPSIQNIWGFYITYINLIYFNVVLL